MVALLDQFRGLATPQGPNTFAVSQLPGRPALRVAKDASGSPAVLIDARPGSSTGIAVALRHFEYRPRCACIVESHDGGIATENFAVLRCHASHDVVLDEYFLRAVSGLLDLLPPEPDEDHVSELVNQLVELFRAIELPARRSIQGLWCELLLIVRAQQRRQAVMAWHPDPDALHDFSAGRQRLEVKSTTRALRQHTFSLDQLLAPQDVAIVVASFLLPTPGRGPTIRELADRILGDSHLPDSLRGRVQQILALGLGRDWREATRIAFDEEGAINGMRFYEAATVPQLPNDLPVGVSDVRFSAELTDVDPLPRTRLVERGGLFAAILED